MMIDFLAFSDELQKIADKNSSFMEISEKIDEKFTPTHAAAIGGTLGTMAGGILSSNAIRNVKRDVASATTQEILCALRGEGGGKNLMSKTEKAGKLLKKLKIVGIPFTLGAGALGAGLAYKVRKQEKDTGVPFTERAWVPPALVGLPGANLARNAAEDFNLFKGRKNLSTLVGGVLGTGVGYAAQAYGRERRARLAKEAAIGISEGSSMSITPMVKSIRAPKPGAMTGQNYAKVNSVVPNVTKGITAGQKNLNAGF